MSDGATQLLDDISTMAELVQTPEQLLVRWAEAIKRLKEAKDLEDELRLKVVAAYFPAGLEEGTNTVELAQGWKLKAKGVINRKVDEEVMRAIAPTLRQEHNIDVNAYVRWTAELKVGEYRKLPAEGKNLFDTAISSSSGKPGLELTPPPQKKG